MREVSSNSFDILIAYVAPGATCLWGMSYLSTTVQVWIGSTPDNPPTVGGFLYVTVASVVAGLLASTVRWAVIDTLHHRTGVNHPPWNFGNLTRHTAAYGILEHNHYRYYQFYGNMLVAGVFAYLARGIGLGFFTLGVSWMDAAYFGMAALLFAGSRDTLVKYYRRVTALLADLEPADLPADLPAEQGSGRARATATEERTPKKITGKPAGKP